MEETMEYAKTLLNTRLWSIHKKKNCGINGKVLRKKEI